MKKRIIGIDVARAFAIFGMIIVNFKIVLGARGDNAWLQAFSSIFEGKAAATFVVLAGIGIALMTKSAVESNDTHRIKKAQQRISKRALFLFVVGLSYIFIWPADILHFYGIYMMIVLLFLKVNRRVIFSAALFIILLYPLLLFPFPYETGWNFETLTYLDFWTIKGFVRSLFLNGFHPVFPWVAFMLIGLWFGRQDLQDTSFIKKSLRISLIIFIVLQTISSLSIEFLAEGDALAREELSIILGTTPMPPLPIYMLSSASIAIVVITSCILICNRFEGNRVLDALYKTGQLALTFYVAHVVIGMSIIFFLFPEKAGQLTLGFSLVYALIFSLLCVFFAVWWRKTRKAGPLEWVMRKLTD